MSRYLAFFLLIIGVIIIMIFIYRFIRRTVLLSQFKKAQRKALRAVEEEVRDNRRARSAILRIYEKL